MDKIISAARALLLEIDAKRGKPLDGKRSAVLDRLHPICIFAEHLTQALSEIEPRNEIRRGVFSLTPEQGMAFWDLSAAEYDAIPENLRRWLLTLAADSVTSEPALVGAMTSDMNALTIIKDLLAWEKSMGGWEAPAWERAKAFVVAAEQDREPIGARMEDGSFITPWDERLRAAGGTPVYTVDEAMAHAEPTEADYEKAARAAGWTHGGDAPGFIFHEETWGSWKAAASWSGSDQEPDGENDKPSLYDTWAECCNGEDIPVGG